MSPVRIYGDQGYLELAGPTQAGNTTLIMPSGTGTSGQVIQTDGAGATSWAAAGKILQVVNATYATSTSNSTSTFADTGLTASITPSSTSSKILIIVSQNGCVKATNNTSLALRLLRDTTQLTVFASQAGANTTTTTNSIGSCSTCYLDSPNTTASVTYKTQFRSIVGVASVAVQVTNGDTAASTITLLEVAA